ncbi:arsenate reductase [Pseudoxanthobacter sp.]|uniref:arsenate reductase n=1 Tax=Pseudoxanthobacter sp. TaxID=1925742 RepID=UPI002FE20E62
MTITIYGIANCDTMKKARTWLAGHGIEAVFHDYRKAGLAPEKLAAWADAVGWEKLLNRSGTTFRKLPEAERSDLTRDRALGLMLAQPGMIRRPVLETGSGLVVGFRPDLYAATFPG